MKIGYKTDENGNEHIAITTIDAHIRAVNVKLLVNINKDVNYPLSSPHNHGYHVLVHNQDNQTLCEFNIETATTQAEVIAATSDFFANQDQFVMIAPQAKSGDTFDYTTQVYDKTAIENKNYDCWDEDLEDLEDNADKVVSVKLNDQLRWEVD
ncbi:MAG: hypothetical protein ACI9FJ_001772 [Alteromonadaceae bacterium]|jgi:hypothetical protein